MGVWVIEECPLTFLSWYQFSHDSPLLIYLGLAARWNFICVWSLKVFHEKARLHAREYRRNYRHDQVTPTIRPKIEGKLECLP